MNSPLFSKHYRGQLFAGRSAENGGDVATYITRFDNNSLLSRLAGSLIVTGNARTNVDDVMVYALA